MGTIHCPGGHSFSDADVPSPHEFVLVPDTAIEGTVKNILETVGAGEDIEARVTFGILSAGHVTYRCPICGRLLVFWNGILERATSYVREGD